jgi:hypothetical protein
MSFTVATVFACGSSPSTTSDPPTVGSSTVVSERVTSTPAASPVASEEATSSTDALFTPGPDWETFKGAKDCITFSYPPNWEARGSGDLETTGELLCPGGTIVSQVVPCTDSAVHGGVTVFVADLPFENTSKRLY